MLEEFNNTFFDKDFVNRGRFLILLMLYIVSPYMVLYQCIGLLRIL